MNTNISPQSLVFRTIPKHFNVDEWVRRIMSDASRHALWKINKKHQKVVSIGEDVYIWRGGPMANAGFIAKAKIRSLPTERPDTLDANLWYPQSNIGPGDALRVELHKIVIANPPIMKTSLPTNLNFTLLNGQGGTSFELGTEESKWLQSNFRP